MSKITHIIFGLIFVIFFGSAAELVGAFLGNLVGQAATGVSTIQTSPYSAFNIFNALNGLNGVVFATTLVCIIIAVVISALRGRSLLVGFTVPFLGVVAIAVFALSLELGGTITTALADPNTINDPMALPNAIEAAIPDPIEFIGFITGVIFALLVCSAIGTVLGALSRSKEAQVGEKAPRSRKAWASTSRTSWECPTCGKELPPGAFSCPNCGTAAVE